MQEKLPFRYSLRFPDVAESTIEATTCLEGADTNIYKEGSIDRVPGNILQNSQLPK